MGVPGGRDKHHPQKQHSTGSSRQQSHSHSLQRAHSHPAHSKSNRGNENESSGKSIEQNSQSSRSNSSESLKSATSSIDSNSITNGAEQSSLPCHNEAIKEAEHIQQQPARIESTVSETQAISTDESGTAQDTVTSNEVHVHTLKNGNSGEELGGHLDDSTGELDRNKAPPPNIGEGAEAKEEQGGEEKDSLNQDSDTGMVFLDKFVGFLPTKCIGIS